MTTINIFLNHDVMIYGINDSSNYDVTICHINDYANYESCFYDEFLPMTTCENSKVDGTFAW